MSSRQWRNRAAKRSMLSMLSATKSPSSSGYTGTDLASMDHVIDASVSNASEQLFASAALTGNVDLIDFSNYA